MAVDRSDGAVKFSVPIFSLLKMKVETFEADKLPSDLAAMPVQKPGSR